MLEALLEGTSEKGQMSFGNFIKALKDLKDAGCGNQPIIFDCEAVPADFSCSLGAGSCGYLVLGMSSAKASSECAVDVLLAKAEEVLHNCPDFPLTTPVFITPNRRYVTGIKRRGDGVFWVGCVILTNEGGSFSESELAEISS